MVICNQIEAGAVGGLVKVFAGCSRISSGLRELVARMERSGIRGCGSANAWILAKVIAG